MSIDKALVSLGGDRLFAAVADLLRDEEEAILDRFDATWEDLTADEIESWTVVEIVQLDAEARLGLDIVLVTYAVEEHSDEDEHASRTIIRGYVLLKPGPEPKVTLDELRFSGFA